MNSNRLWIASIYAFRAVGCTFIAQGAHRPCRIGSTANRIAAFMLLLIISHVSPSHGSATSFESARAAFEAGIEAFDQAQQFITSEPQRARQLFRSAAQHLESVRAAGIVSGPLEYNLGNCYLQAGETGKAVLHYRRAQRLTPNDPKLAANLAEARRRCLTSPVPHSPPVPAPSPGLAVESPRGPGGCPTEEPTSRMRVGHPGRATP